MTAGGEHEQRRLSDRARLWALRMLGVSLVALAALPGGEATGVEIAGSADNSSVSESGASPDTDTADDPAGTQDQIDVQAVEPTATPVPAPLVIVRLWSPAPGTAQVEGALGDGAPETVTISIDGIPLGTAQIEPNEVGQFSFEVSNLAAGAQTLCLDTVCQRVFVADAATEPVADIESRIVEATVAAADLFDISGALPGWSIAAAGPDSSTGGITQADTKSIVINANPGRTVEDFTITVLHEVGHAIDAEWMDDTKRQEFRTLRGHDPALVWGNTEFAVGEDRWRDSAEDFAEMFVAWVLDGNYATASQVVASQPTVDELAAFCELVAIEGVTCGVLSDT